MRGSMAKKPGLQRNAEDLQMISVTSITPQSSDSMKLIVEKFHDFSESK